MNLRTLTRGPILTITFQTEEVRWTVGGPDRIKSSGRAPLLRELIDDGVILDPIAAAEALRTAPNFGGGKRMRAVIGIPAQRSVFRQLELPVLPKRQFADMVEREIRREMPMLAENAYTSWKKIKDVGDRSFVFVVGVARDVLDSHIAAVRAAGLTPASADLCILAAARAIGDPNCILANVEESAVEICVMREGVPAIVRHVPITESPDGPGWVTQLGDELARTLKFYRDSRRDNTALDGVPISFVGSAAGKALFGGHVGAAVAHDVALPPLRITITPEQDTSRFAANIGLAMKRLAA